MRKIKLAVLFGGRSGEHEVSLMSARSIMNALDPNKYELYPVGITREGRWLAGGDPMKALEEKNESGCFRAQIVLDPEQPGLLLMENDWKKPTPVKEFIELDLVFPVLHGPFGEDGTVQGLLELAGLPYVGSGVLGSAVGMDKVIMKQLFEKWGLPVAPYLFFNLWQWRKGKEEMLRKILSSLGLPLFVKPANLGSSVGISKVKKEEDLGTAIELAFSYDLKVIVEAFVAGKEIECSVLGNEELQVSLPGEIIPCNEFYDYRAKYIDGHSQLVIPAPIPGHLVSRVQELSIAAFQAVGAEGLARVDFFVNESQNKVVLNEINTMPGFTSISMYPKLWEATGIGYSELLDRIIQLALERHRARKKLKTTFY